MSDKIIEVEHLSKSYVLKHQNAERYTALRDVISNKAKAIVSGKLGARAGKSEEFWALNDVSFDIERGDRVGIIGRNGAGKSTLLKILSRIVTPTIGRITIDGRVASLLEVGTGFHAELTGRENVFLNGSILGMSKAEIKSKFDEIVAFSEVERFLDTPVKRYSSGMYVRLAFAVAAHLEPEILIVDEVLAVGDAAFQKKCLGKMKDVAGEGRTVLFVSHNMGAISNLCTNAILLNKGKVEFNGSVDGALKVYHNMQTTKSNLTYSSVGESKEIFISEVCIKNAGDEIADVFVHDEPIYVSVKFNANIVLDDVLLSMSVTDYEDRKIFSTERLISEVIRVDKKQGEALVKIPAEFLFPNEYKLNVGIHIPNLQVFDFLDSVCSFTVVDNGSEFSNYKGVDVGCVFAHCEWKLM